MWYRHEVSLGSKMVIRAAQATGKIGLCKMKKSTFIRNLNVAEVPKEREETGNHRLPSKQLRQIPSTQFGDWVKWFIHEDSYQQWVWWNLWEQEYRMGCFAGVTRALKAFLFTPREMAWLIATPSIHKLHFCSYHVGRLQHYVDQGWT